MVVLINNMKKLKLTQNKYALVDDEDFDYLNQWKWHCAKGDKYVARREYFVGGKGKSKIVYMHRLIMNTPEGMETDHINRNGLDNRRENLRICTGAENRFNHKLISTNKTGYHGVYWDKLKGKWGVGISIKGKHKGLGYYENIKKAALAYNEAAILYRGKFANLNSIGGNK